MLDQWFLNRCRFLLRRRFNTTRSSLYSNLFKCIIQIQETTQTATTDDDDDDDDLCGCFVHSHKQHLADLFIYLNDRKQ